MDEESVEIPRETRPSAESEKDLLLVTSIEDSIATPRVFNDRNSFFEKAVIKAKGENGLFEYSPAHIGRELLKDHARTIFHIDKLLPDTIIAPIPLDNEDFMEKYNEPYQYLRSALFRIPPERRPIIIYKAKGKIPPITKSFLITGLFAENEEELQKNLQLVSEIKIAKENPIIDFNTLASLQERQYDNSHDLREWELRTADTYQTLHHILARFKQRERLFYQSNPKMLELGLQYAKLVHLNDTPEIVQGRIQVAQGRFDLTTKQIQDNYEKDRLHREHDLGLRTNTVLDLGCGEGRISGMLARLGYHVTGIDISQTQLDASEKRLEEEGKGIRGEVENPTLSYNTLRQLEAKEVITPEQIITDDQEASDNFLRIKGSIIQVYPAIEQTLRNWNQLYPNKNWRHYFGYSRYPFYGNQMDIGGFDAVICTWNTFCEIPDPNSQQIVLNQVFDLLRPGGEVILEIPNIMAEPYKSMLDIYHNQNPDKPYGLHQEQSADGKKFSHRYFPSKEEMIRMIIASGLSIDPIVDIESFTFSDKTDSDKKIEELVIRARKI